MVDRVHETQVGGEVLGLMGPPEQAVDGSWWLVEGLSKIQNNFEVVRTGWAVLSVLLMYQDAQKWQL